MAPHGGDPGADMHSGPEPTGLGLLMTTRWAGFREASWERRGWAGALGKVSRVTSWGQGTASHGELVVGSGNHSFPVTSRGEQEGASLWRGTPTAPPCRRSLR